MEWLEGMLSFAWRPALAVIPIALLVAAVCRLIPHRPATRHGLWLTVLCWFVVSGFLPTLRMPASNALTDEHETATAVEVNIVADDAVTDIEARDDDKADIPAPRLARGVLMEDVSKPRAARGVRTAESLDASGDAARDVLQANARVSHPRILESSTPRALPSRYAIEDSAVENLAEPAHSGIPVFVYQGIDPQPSAPPEPASIPRRSRDFSPGSPVASTMPKAPAAAVLEPMPMRSVQLRSLHTLDSAFAVEGLPDSENAFLESAHASLLNGETEWLVLQDAALRDVEAFDDNDFAATEDVPLVPEAEDETPVAIAAGAQKPSRLNRVTAALFNVRDAAAQIPLLPVEIWLAGVTLVILTVSTRLATGRRLMNKSWNAPAEVMAVVNDVAQQLGIESPTTVMIDRDVSPMIWCGKGFRLVLPARLWSELDDAGRRAVVCHELAHLRRRDHWVRRLELAVTAVFWWHPVLWYVRHRLDEEADLSCDAWVAYLLPQQRRAYAQALIQTREYVSQGVPSGLGIGLTSAHAKRIARRIHMIMTNQKQPGFPAMGMLLAASVMVAGWVSLPSEACPPEKKQNCAEPSAAPEPEPAPEPDGNSLFGHDSEAPIPDSVFGLLKAHDEDEDDADGEDEAAEYAEEMAEIDEMRTEYHELMREIHRLETELAARQRQAHRSRDADTPRAPRAVRMPRPARAPAAHGRSFTPPQAPTAPHIAGFVSSRGGAKISKRYEMPQDKLEKFTKLMVLEDVPVLVRPMKEAIEVQATEAEHVVVAAFIDMIRDGWEDKRYEMPENKLDAMWDLMALNSVPIRVNGGSGSIGVEATAAQHKIFRAFCELIHPTGEKEAAIRDVLGQSSGLATGPRLSIAREYLAAVKGNEVDGARALLKQATEKAQGRSKALRSQQRQMRSQAQQLQRQAQQRERQAAQLQRQAEKRQRDMEAKMRELEAELRRAEEAHEHSHDDADHDDHSHTDKLEALHDHHHRVIEEHAQGRDAMMRDLEKQVHEFNVQAEALMRAAESIENNAENFESRNDQIKNHLEQLHDVLRNLDRVSTESKAYDNAWQVVRELGQQGTNFPSAYATLNFDNSFFSQGTLDDLVDVKFNLDLPSLNESNLLAKTNDFMANTYWKNIAFPNNVSWRSYADAAKSLGTDKDAKASKNCDGN